MPQPIDPSTAIRRALIVILCIFVCAGFVVWATISQAFTFKIENNLDATVVCGLFERDHDLSEYPGPINRFTGEIKGHSSRQLIGAFESGKYFVFWHDINELWDTRAEFEIPPHVTNEIVTVSIDFIPMKITVIK